MNFENIAKIAEELINSPSPAGYMKEVMPILKKHLKFLDLELTEMYKGGIFLTIKGKESKKYQRMVSAHVDTLGAMVKEIKPNGRLKIIKVGGFAWRVVEGEYCQIITRSGKKIGGTLLPVFSSAHLSAEHEKIVQTEDTMEVRVDLNAHSIEDIKEAGIIVGDYIAFEPRFMLTDNGFIKSRYLDNKINVAIVLEVLKHLNAKKDKLPVTTHIFFNTHEELGYGGNSNINSEIKEYLALDIGIVSPGQNSNEESVSICAMDSSGPFDYNFVNFLHDLAEEHNISHKIDVYPYYNSDATAALASGNDLMRGLIGPGVDASHSLERAYKKGIMQTTKLLYKYLTTPSPKYLEHLS